MRRQEGPLVKPANLAKMANLSKSPTTCKPVQMRRQEGPLRMPANLANLANLSKSLTTWNPMQMRRQEGPLASRRVWANLAMLCKIADNLEAKVHEQTRGPFGNFCLTLLHLKLIFYRLIQPRLCTQHKTHRTFQYTNAFGTHVNRWNAMYHCCMMILVHSR